MKKKPIDTRRLWDSYHELNARYFNNSVYVHEIKFGKFFADLLRGGVTFGLYRYERCPTTNSILRNQIIINTYLLMRSITGAYPWITEVALYHEMCHAHLILNLYPERHDLATCAVHGPEFWELMLQHPLAKQAEKVVQEELAEVINRESAYDAARYIEKHPNAELRPVYTLPEG